MLATVVACACLALAAGGVAAQDKKDASKEAMKPMTMQECKDMMAKMKDAKDMKKDDAMMKKQQMCDDMMKKDAGMMKAPEPAKKQ
jgi:hypothetical protein